MGCRNTVLYGWIKSYFSHATVTVLWSSFSSACLHRPLFFHINIHWWVIFEENAEKMKFIPQLGVRGLSFAVCIHTDETSWAEDHRIHVEAAVISSFFPSSAVVTWAGLQGSHGSSGKGATGAALQLRATPMVQSPSAKALQLFHHSAGKCCWVHKSGHTQNKNERSLISPSAILMTTNKLVLSKTSVQQSMTDFPFTPRSQWAEHKPDTGSVPSFFIRLHIYGLELRLLHSLAFLAPCNTFPFLATDFEQWLVNIAQWVCLHITEHKAAHQEHVSTEITRLIYICLSISDVFILNKFIFPCPFSIGMMKYLLWM